ncbi:hypothetical protein Glo7428_5254 (plasmid) [Gloeocapsa sp. PCC 7428]|nr:hypothetical protein Glo7428_5254 [Gloeocapsa sp. PCC 7428]
MQQEAKILTLVEEDTWRKYIFVKTGVQIKGDDLCLVANGERVVISVENEGTTRRTTELVVKYMNTTVALEPTVDEGRLALAHILVKKLASSLLWTLYYQTKAFRKTALDQLNIKGDEPFGKLYSAELDLCFACLDFWDSNDLSSICDHKNALDWWGQLIEEDICYQLNLPWAKGSKADEEKAIQQILGYLNSWLNPYPPEQLPHHFNTIESAITIGKPRPSDNNKLRKARREFREGAWKQYKEALHGVKRSLHTSSGLYRLHLDGDKLYAQTGRKSRSHIIFEPVPICLPEFLPQIGG